MLGGVATRERTCPACDGSVRDRAARWCGSCGAPLEPVTDDLAAAHRASPPWRRVLLAVIAVAAVAGITLTGGGLIDRSSRTATVDDAAVAGPDEDALADLPRGRPPAPTRTTEPTCSDGPRHGCFAWFVETGGRSDYGSSVAAGGYVVTDAAADGSIAAYDLHDGTQAWTAEADASPDGGPPTLMVAERLVVHHAEEALVARDLASGEERWRNPDLAAFGLHWVEQHDDALLLAGHQTRRFPEDGPIEASHAVVAVDATSGQLRWHEGGTGGAALGAGGVGVLLDDGRLRAHASDGTLRWEVDAGTAGDPDSHVWVRGHTISVHGGSEPGRLHRLTDGEPLPFAAETLAHDGEHSFMVAVEGSPDGEGYTIGDEYLLLDETDVLWRVPAPAQHCFGPVQLEPTTITMTSCEGETIVLDRGDGEVVSRTALDDDARMGHAMSFSVGPFELRHEAAGTGGDDLIVVDGRTGTEVVRLPSESWPVVDATGGGWPTDRDGVLVLEGRGWLAALELPEPVSDDQDAGAGAE